MTLSIGYYLLILQKSLAIVYKNDLYTHFHAAQEKQKF